MTEPKARDRYRQEGVSAFFRCGGLSSPIGAWRDLCPYDRRTVEGREWFAGFLEAERGAEDPIRNLRRDTLEEVADAVKGLFGA